MGFINKILTLNHHFGTGFALKTVKQNSPLILFSL